MASMISFEILNCEKNMDAQGSLQASTVDFVMFPEADLVPDGHQNNLSTCSSISSVGLDTMTAELSERLKKLSDENVDLKGKLEKGNSVMLEQLNAMEAWRNQIVQSNSKHHAELEDLVKQNQKLQSEKEELENIVKQQHEKEETEKSSGEAADQNQHTCSDCEQLKKQLECTLAAKESIADQLSKEQKAQVDLEKSMEELTLKMNGLQNKNTDLEAGKVIMAAFNDVLSTDLSDLRSQCELLKEKYSDLEKQLECTLTAKESIADELSKQQKTQGALEKSMEELTAKMNDLQSRSEDLEAEKVRMAALNDVLSTDLSDLRSRCELLKEKCSDLEKQLQCTLTDKESIGDELSKEQTARGDLVERVEFMTLEMSKLQSGSKVLEKEKEKLAAAKEILLTDLSYLKKQCAQLKKKCGKLEEQLECTLTAKGSIADELSKQQKTQGDLEKSIEELTLKVNDLQSRSEDLEAEKVRMSALNAVLSTDLSDSRSHCELLKKKCSDLEKQLECTLAAKESIADELSKQQKTQGDLEKSIEELALKVNDLRSRSEDLEAEKVRMSALNAVLSTNLSDLRSHLKNTSKLLEAKEEEAKSLHNKFDQSDAEKLKIWTEGIVKHLGF